MMCLFRPALGAVAVSALALCAAPRLVHAQSNVTVYGLIDTAVRYSTHEGPDGSGKAQLSDGVLTGSRLGLRGAEALGGGYKAEFVLETGYSPDTGINQQGGRLFGRQATLGLSSGFGRVTVGRQFTLPQDVIGSYEATYLGNLVLLGYQGTTYTGLRQDNMVKYVGAVGSTTLMASYTPGERPGQPVGTGATYAGAVSHTSGRAMLAGVYQVQKDVESYFGSVVPATRQTTWSVGGTYALDRARLYLGYTWNHLAQSDTVNQAVYTGFNATLAPAWSLIGAITYDHVSRGGRSGQRVSTGAILGYALSKRSDVYVAADYTWLQGEWIGVASTPGFFTPFYASNPTRIGAMAGVRTRF